MAKPRVYPSMAKKQAKELLIQNQKLHRSWRSISLEDFNGMIKPGTLCRFAISNGEWIPKNKRIQDLLGISRGLRIRARVIIEITETELINALTKKQPIESLASMGIIDIIKNGGTR